MKAYRIHNDIVAAGDDQEAIRTWAQYYERPAAQAGVVEAVDPEAMHIMAEREDGALRLVKLADVMPAAADGPQIVAQGSCDCGDCGPAF